MHPLSIALIYILVWWVVFFMTLSVGIKVPEKPEKGHAASAPEQPHIGKKILATSLIAAVLTAGVVWIIQSGIISLRP